MLSLLLMGIGVVPRLGHCKERIYGVQAFGDSVLWGCTPGWNPWAMGSLRLPGGRQAVSTVHSWVLPPLGPLPWGRDVKGEGGLPSQPSRPPHISFSLVPGLSGQEGGEASTRPLSSSFVSKRKHSRSCCLRAPGPHADGASLPRTGVLCPHADRGYHGQRSFRAAKLISIGVHFRHLVIQNRAASFQRLPGDCVVRVIYSRQSEVLGNRPLLAERCVI